MNSVFIGGSRKITRLNPAVRARLDNIIQKQLRVFVGDANGADKAIQKYLSEQKYENVLVFCTAGECRNNLGAWDVRSVTPPHKSRDFAFFTAKDVEMARDADFALMLWDGESAGTMVNVARLVASAKPVVIYLSREKQFLTLKKREELEQVLTAAPTDVSEKVHRYIREHAREFQQANIFGVA